MFKNYSNMILLLFLVTIALSIYYTHLLNISVHNFEDESGAPVTKKPFAFEVIINIISFICLFFFAWLPG